MAVKLQVRQNSPLFLKKIPFSMQLSFIRWLVEVWMSLREPGSPSAHIPGHFWFQMELFLTLSVLRSALSFRVYSYWNSGDINWNKNTMFKELPESWNHQPSAAAAMVILRPEPLGGWLTLSEVINSVIAPNFYRHINWWW